MPVLRLCRVRGLTLLQPIVGRKLGRARKNLRQPVSGNGGPFLAAVRGRFFRRTVAFAFFVHATIRAQICHE